MEALKMLEPLVGKLAWAVLRGLGAGNSPRLPYTLGRGHVQKVLLLDTLRQALKTACFGDELLRGKPRSIIAIPNRRQQPRFGPYERSGS